MVRHRSGQVTGSGEAQNAGRQFGDGCRRQVCHGGQNCVRACHHVIAPHIAIGFGGVLERLKIVAHGYHREENQYEDNKRDQLRTPAAAMA